MKLPFPDWHMAKLALEGYGEDGVSGKLGYDSETGTWYAEVDDDEYAGYIANLRWRHHAILEDFGTIDWRGATNIQGSALEPPEANENRLAIYLLDCSCKTAIGFKVNASLSEVARRENRFMYVGSTCMSCGRKMIVVLTWEDVKPKKGGSNEDKSPSNY